MSYKKPTYKRDNRIKSEIGGNKAKGLGYKPKTMKDESTAPPTIK